MALLFFEELWVFIRNIKPESWVAFAAILTAVLQNRILIKQNHLMAAPFLHAYYEPAQDHLSVYLENAGVGTAIIEDYVIIKDGHEYRDTHVETLFRGVFTKFYITYIRPNGAFKVGSRSNILSVYDIDENTAMALQDTLSSDYRLCVRYKSISGKRYFYDSWQAHEWKKGLLQK